MIWNCQRQNHPDHPGYFHVHQVEAPDEATARLTMANRSMNPEWINPDRTSVWVDDC